MRAIKRPYSTRVCPFSSATNWRVFLMRASDFAKPVPQLAITQGDAKQRVAAYGNPMWNFRGCLRVLVAGLEIIVFNAQSHDRGL
jgi:hypothetical protein